MPEWSCEEKIGLIRYLVVKQGSRKKGIGQQLFAQILKWFREEEKVA